MGGRFLGPRPCLFIDGIKVLRTMGCVGIRFISNLLEGGKGLVGVLLRVSSLFPVVSMVTMVSIMKRVSS